MSTVYVDGNDHEVRELTTEQVFYLIQCSRITKEQLDEWKQKSYDKGFEEGFSEAKENFTSYSDTE